jgi:hypothetical protein
VFTGGVSVAMLHLVHAIVAVCHVASFAPTRTHLMPQQLLDRRFHLHPCCSLALRTLLLHVLLRVMSCIKTVLNWVSFQSNLLAAYRW